MLAVEAVVVVSVAALILRVERAVLRYLTASALREVSAAPAVLLVFLALPVLVALVVPVRRHCVNPAMLVEVRRLFPLPRLLSAAAAAALNLAAGRQVLLLPVLQWALRRQRILAPGVAVRGLFRLLAVLAAAAAAANMSN